MCLVHSKNYMNVCYNIYYHFGKNNTWRCKLQREMWTSTRQLLHARGFFPWVTCTILNPHFNFVGQVTLCCQFTDKIIGIFVLSHTEANLNPNTESKLSPKFKSTEKEPCLFLSIIWFSVTSEEWALLVHGFEWLNTECISLKETENILTKH